MVFDEESYQDQMYSDVPVEGVAAGTTFTLCGFRDAVLAEGLLVKGCVFERCVFVGCTFKNVRFENCAFNTCVFKTSDFMGRVASRTAGLWGPSFWARAAPACASRAATGPTPNLAGLKFVRQTLTKVRMCEASLARCTFRECDLTECDLTRATVRGATFEDCDLRGPRLDGIAAAEARWTGSRIDLLQCVAIAQAVYGRGVR